ncbi:MAG: RNA 2',3'-cyclic phosphodiesterase [Chloroflexi bacterium]|nr:RNA 2',3'-cyclic phosphodiesterase [Chloroflexota bacterium]
MEAIRSFIAIHLPEEIRVQLESIINQLKAGCPCASVRWVQSQNIHLTLKFLGDISPKNLKILTDLLESETAKHAAFEFNVGKLGAFPNAQRPSVIWVGVESSEALLHLQHRIDVETQRLGYASEARKFSPHLTLGRISRSASAADIRQIAETLAAVKVGSLGKVRADKVHLFRSDLKPGGAVYTPLYVAPLSSGEYLQTR